MPCSYGASGHAIRLVVEKLTTLIVIGFAKTQYNPARTEIHFIA